MATNGIATRANANAIVAGAYASDTSRCVTYSSVDSTGLFKITPAYSGKYTNATNRLVLTSELAAKPKARILFKINDYTIKRFGGDVTVSSISVKGLKVMYPGTSSYLTMLATSFPATSFTTGEVVLSNTALGSYTFNTSGATATIFLSDGTSFRGTCDFTPGQFVKVGEEIYTQSINAVEGDNYLTLSIRGSHSVIDPDPPIIDTAQFKVRLLFSILDVAVYSFKIGIGDWTIRNSSGTVLATGSFPPTEYQPYQLPQEIQLNDLTGGRGSAYYYIDLYTSARVADVPANEPCYIKMGFPTFQYRANNMQSWMIGNVNVVNLLAANYNYGYLLLDSHTDTIKHIKLDCGGGIRL